MIKIPFDISYRQKIENSEVKVVTRTGEVAKIICWNADNPDNPIVALVHNNKGKEKSYMYPASGVKDPPEQSLYILVPEEDDPKNPLSEILQDFVDDWNSNQTGEKAEIIGSYTGKIISQVLKDERPLLYASLTGPDHMAARELGRKETLRLIPTWKKTEAEDGLYWKEKDLESLTLVYGGYKISVLDLFEKLPKEIDGKEQNKGFMAKI